MEVVDLKGEHEQLYFICLEDWSEQMREAGDHKETWYREMRDKGLRVKLALADGGEVGGMIEYMPIEYAFAEGSGLYFITCIFVHGRDQGRGNFQERGMGKALLTAAEEDAKARGATGMAAWIKASWFQEQGYRKADSDKGVVLMWKPFVSDAMPPCWIKKRYVPELTPGKVTVTSFLNGQCPARNVVHERARRAAQEFGDRIMFRTIRTSDKEVMRQYGEKDALYLDGRKLKTSPAPSYKVIRGVIARRIKML